MLIFPWTSQFVYNILISGKCKWCIGFHIKLCLGVVAFLKFWQALKHIFCTARKFLKWLYYLHFPFGAYIKTMLFCCSFNSMLIASFIRIYPRSNHSIFGFNCISWRRIFKNKFAYILLGKFVIPVMKCKTCILLNIMYATLCYTIVNVTII
jgi:hypothetical protein